MNFEHTVVGQNKHYRFDS